VLLGGLHRSGNKHVEVVRDAPHHLAALHHNRVCAQFDRHCQRRPFSFWKSALQLIDVFLTFMVVFKLDAFNTIGF
jgi:hypothetical protein